MTLGDNNTDVEAQSVSTDKVNVTNSGSIQDSGTDAIQFDGTGNVGIQTSSPSAALDMSGVAGDLRINTGQAIKGGGGNEIVSITSSFNTINDDSGTKAFEAKSGTKNAIHAYSGHPIVFDDQEGGFQAVKYLTSSSSPGTLELKNADVDVGSNDITNAASVSTDELNGGLTNNNSITGIAGTDGEVVGVACYQFLAGETVTVSSTSFTSLGDQNDRIIADQEALSLTNSNIKVRVTAFVSSLSSNETVTIRYVSQSNSEVSASTSGANLEGPFADPDDVGQSRIEAKVSGGSADLEMMTIQFGVKIQ